jgi:hypothetical protein
LSADSIAANVAEGQTTEVEFFSPARRENLRCRIVVGDGSENHWKTGTGTNAERKTSNVNSREPAFRISLKPVADHGGSFPSSDWQEASDNGEILLSDVGPGDYHLVVDDWMISRGFKGELFRTQIHVSKNEPLEVRIPLGAGCRTGVIRWSKEVRYMVQVIARGRRTGTIRHAQCDDDGNFCLRYLPADTYQILAHDPDAGWCSLPDANVNDDSLDLGMHELFSGGTLRVHLSDALTHDQNISVIAIHESGLSPDELMEDDLQNRPVEFSQLWPGTWTVAVRKGDTTLLQKSVELKSTATVEVPLEK